MRNNDCPICQQFSKTILRLQFGKKLRLPAEVEVRHCDADNFLFLSGGQQSDYDNYYAGIANDSVHRDVSGGAVRSPISQRQSEYLTAALGGFFDIPRRVLDFGCGEGSLLVELATNFPKSTFFGFEPGPAALVATAKARQLGLKNLLITSLNAEEKGAPLRKYDLVIASHVIEHMVDFDILRLLPGSMESGALLYAEVPDSLRYEAQERLEFLYYFDRLHVNHFTPQSLARLMRGCGFNYLEHFEYAFPYWDGGEYPALGMLFTVSGGPMDIPSPCLLEASNRYIAREKQRAKLVSSAFDEFDGVLIWGVGDNFHRSLENGGPLSSVNDFILLDRRSQEVMVRNAAYQTIAPEKGIRESPWPVVVTISGGQRGVERSDKRDRPGKKNSIRVSDRRSSRRRHPWLRTCAC